MNKLLTFLCILLLAAGCACKGPKVRAEFIPQAPDYADAAMWYHVDADSLGTGGDVFYVVSTWEKDWMTPDSALCHYADVWDAGQREHMATEIRKVAAYMAPGNRFWAPYYRHTTIEAWDTQNEDTIYRRTRLSMEDVCKAFDHFLAARDTTRPFVIAGFSQGGLAMVELLKHMDDRAYSHLAAAYVLGGGHGGMQPHPSCARGRGYGRNHLLQYGQGRQICQEHHRRVGHLHQSRQLAHRRRAGRPA